MNLTGRDNSKILIFFIIFFKNIYFKETGKEKMTHLFKRNILRVVHMETISTKAKSSNTYSIYISLNILNLQLINEELKSHAENWVSEKINWRNKLEIGWKKWLIISTKYSSNLVPQQGINPSSGLNLIITRGIRGINERFLYRWCVNCWWFSHFSFLFSFFGYFFSLFSLLLSANSSSLSLLLSTNTSNS